MPPAKHVSGKKPIPIIFRGSRSRWACLVSGLALTTIPLCLSAHPLPPEPEDRRVTELEEIQIIGRAEDLTGEAVSASQGIVGQPEFEFRPFLRNGELLEVIPGMAATQHSGSGKANQYFLRGFNLDHGTDFSLSVDGVPYNLPTHGHGQGYLDVNSIIPELVDVVEYGKGPYYSEIGDFSSAGYGHIETVHRLPASLMKLGIGENGYYRALAANSNAVGPGDLLYAAEATFYDGPWRTPEGTTKFNGMMRYTLDTPDWGFTVLGTGYYNDWHATDQVPRRAVDAGLISRLGTIDPSDGGNTRRFSLAGSWWRKTPASESQIDAYAFYSDLNLWSNFTFFLENPDLGDQIKQEDRRVTLGTNGFHTWYTEWGGFAGATTLGSQVRFDHIPDVGLFTSHLRNVFDTVSDDRVNESSFAVFGRNETQWLSWLRTIAGLRGDFYWFDVTSRTTPANSGRRADHLLSPKLSIVAGPWYATEYYVNLGTGFHSNDARGTVIRIDPITGDPVESVDPLVRSKGAEIGLRTTLVPKLASTFALWCLEVDSELVFVGDAGTTEPSGESRRYGVEWTNYYQVTDWLTLDADLAFTQAEFTDEPLGDDIPNSVGRVITAGATVDLPNGFFGSLRLRHFGDVPLTENGAVEAGSTTLVNLGIGYRYREFRAELDVFNLLNSHDNDIAYFYASRLPGEPPEGVEDILFHPAEPRQVRLTVLAQF